MRTGVTCFNLSPQGDGNTAQTARAYQSPVSIYPRKGTVTARTAYSYTSEAVSIYLRKGTVTSGSRSSTLIHFGFNLSPQGDGNSRHMIIVQKSEVSIYPRKGTVNLPFNHLQHQQPVSIYPRKGTVTISNFSISTARSRFNLSPQGDGNNLMGRRRLSRKKFQFIPARGR